MAHSQSVDQVWYVAYGSNLAAARLGCYVSGGQPAGSARDYKGCRDRSAPAAVAAVEIVGGLVFAGRSGAWGGGMALYDADVAGTLAVRGYLLTVEQFADVVAQEMWQPPGGETAQGIAAAVPTVRDVHVCGPGRYETLYNLGMLEGWPMLTVSSGAVSSMALAPPAAAYLWWIAVGLRESHGWDDETIARYLVGCPGAIGQWQVDDILAIVGEPAPPIGP